MMLDGVDAAGLACLGGFRGGSTGLVLTRALPLLLRPFTTTTTTPPNSSERPSSSCSNHSEGLAAALVSLSNHEKISGVRVMPPVSEEARRRRGGRMPPQQPSQHPPLRLRTMVLTLCFGLSSSSWYLTAYTACAVPEAAER